MMIETISRTNPKHATITPTYNLSGKNGEETSSGRSHQEVVETTTKNVIKNGKLIVEQYDKHGKLIRKTPPGYLPPGEKV